MSKGSKWTLLALVSLLSSQSPSWGHDRPALASETTEANVPKAQIKPIWAQSETDPVPNEEDAADDPAVWIHPSEPQQSRIFGSNKKGGLLQYGLNGRQLGQWDKYAINNIDVRYNFPWKGKMMDLLVGSSKDENAFIVMGIDPSSDGRELQYLAPPFKVGPLAYGICMHHDLLNNEFYVFVTHKTGEISQWWIKEGNPGELRGTLVRSLKVDSQVEGCVVDDEYGVLYVAEEAKGLWKFKADAGGGHDRELVASIEGNSSLEADLEGVTLYPTSRGQGYLIVSVQERNQFAVFNRTGKNDYLFSFSVTAHQQNPSIDLVTHTDGIDVIPTNLGPEFPMGLLIVQDDENHDIENGRENMANQNFKLIPWQSVACGTDFPLMIDNTWNPRKLVYRGAP